MKSLLKKLFSKRSDPIDVISPKGLEHIFSHLRGSEVLHLSLVSKKWYKFIGNSAVCMDKIKIHITECSWSQQRIFNKADLLRALDNGRKYRHLSIACIRDHITKEYKQFTAEHKLLMALFQWKSVLLWNHSFENEMELINFLGLMEPFVEEIALRAIRIEKFIGVASPIFEFPNLKSLRLINVPNFVHCELFKKVESLKEFTVETYEFLPRNEDHSEEITERVKGIKQILLLNPSINLLEIFLEQKDFDCMFFDKGFINNIHFRLKMLMVGRFKKLIKDKSNYFPMKNFGKFLRLHTKSLSELYLPECLGDEISEIIINEMENLRSLTMHQNDEANCNISFAKAKLFVNESIEHLDIWTRSVQLTEIITTMLPLLPNLKQLTTRIIDQKILDVMANKNPHLEIVETDFFTATVPPQEDTLPNLQNIIVYTKNNDEFKELLEAKKKLSNFETIFLKSPKAFRPKRKLKSKSFTEL